MDIGACFTIRLDNEVAKFTEAADKTLAQRLSICRPRPPVASDLPARDRTKVQKICIGEIIYEKIFAKTVLCVALLLIVSIIARNQFGQV